MITATFRPVLRTAAIAAGTGLLASGCSLLDLSGGPAPRTAATPAVTTPAPVPHATPRGFVPVDAGRIGLALPPGWTPDAPPRGWSYAGVLQSSSDVFGRAGVITKVVQAPDARIVALASTSSFELATPGVRTGSKRPIALRGARSAVRVDYTFTTPGAEDGQELPSRGTDVAIIYDGANGDGDTTAVVVRVSGLATHVTPQLLDTIVGTIAVAA